MNAEEREAYIKKTVDAMPPLTPQQITKLQVLFDWDPPLDGGDAV